MSVDGTLSIRRRDLDCASPVTARASVIEADGLTKSYGDARALDGVSLTVPHGTVLALLGPNGAGKTTAVSILATLLTPDEGSTRPTSAGLLPGATVEEYRRNAPGSP